MLNMIKPRYFLSGNNVLRWDHHDHSFGGDRDFLKHEYEHRHLVNAVKATGTCQTNPQNHKFHTQNACTGCPLMQLLQSCNSNKSIELFETMRQTACK